MIQHRKSENYYIGIFVYSWCQFGAIWNQSFLVRPQKVSHLLLRNSTDRFIMSQPSWWGEISSTGNGKTKSQNKSPLTDQRAWMRYVIQSLKGRWILQSEWVRAAGWVPSLGPHSPLCCCQSCRVGGGLHCAGGSGAPGSLVCMTTISPPSSIPCTFFSIPSRYVLVIGVANLWCRRCICVQYVCACVCMWVCTSVIT